MYIPMRFKISYIIMRHVSLLSYTCHSNGFSSNEVLDRIRSKDIQIQPHFPHRDPDSGHHQGAGRGGEDGVVPLVGGREPSQCCAV